MNIHFSHRQNGNLECTRHPTLLCANYLQLVHGGSADPISGPDGRGAEVTDK